MKQNARPLNYTAVKTVARDVTSAFLSGSAAIPIQWGAGENRPTASGGTGGTTPEPALVVANVHSDMAITESETQTDTPTETTHRIDLRELGADRLPNAAARCAVTVVGDVTSTAEVRCEIVETTWVVDVALRTGELTGVYDEHGPTTKPTTVPDWLAAVCEAVGVDEVTL